MFVLFSVSFEDKRRQNFDLGEQALERKRQALLEQQRREKVCEIYIMSIVFFH